MRTASEAPRPPAVMHCCLKGGAVGSVVKAMLLASALAFVCAEQAGSQATQPTAPACPRSGQVWWNELLASDTDKLAAFYADVVGWKIKAVDPENTKLPPRTPEDRYVLFMDGSQEAAGLMKSSHRDAAHSGAGWFMYIQVSNVDAVVAKVQQKGGKVLRPAATTAEGDRIAVVSDPLGNAFGLVTPGKAGC